MEICAYNESEENNCKYKNLAAKWICLTTAVRAIIEREQKRTKAVTAFKNLYVKEAQEGNVSDF